MKLLRVKIVAADTCGGLLDDFEFQLHDLDASAEQFLPICLVGPNGTGKSQLLQVISETFQSIFCEYASEQERREVNPRLQFEIEYLIRPPKSAEDTHIRIRRLADSRKRLVLTFEKLVESDWEELDPEETSIDSLLPTKVVGYTSGGNETFSLPFLISRSGYAKDVREKALDVSAADARIPDTRLMLIDYGTHLEVLVSNLLLGSSEQREALLEDPRLKDLHSFRCVVQLAPRTVTKRRNATTKGVQLTSELEAYIDQLKRACTCYDYDDKTELYTFDFLVDKEIRKGFKHYWKTSEALYNSLHKLAMLNDLSIPKQTRTRFDRDANQRKFAARLPEPQDEDKVFRFEEVRFVSSNGNDHGVVDYVSLSDGEHQLAQLLGTMCMISAPNTLFLLDEPESHFNPQWRTRFVSRLMELPTAKGRRGGEGADVAMQDCLMTTHAPFLASDLPREQVLIFSKDDEGIHIRRPDLETYGTTFDSILEECFGVVPPISQLSKSDIQVLMESDDVEAIEEGIQRLGHSIDKVFLVDRLQQLKEGKGA